jgi:hypothetical protein
VGIALSYGYYISVKKSGIWIMLNGRMFSFFKGMDSGRWQVEIWSNWWRKNKVPLPKR